LGDSILNPNSNETQASVEMMAFYIAVGLLGQNDQMASYAMFMERVRDDCI